MTVAAGRARPAAEVPTDNRRRLSMLRAFRGDPLALLLGLRDHYGEIVGLSGTPFPLYLLSDPSAIQEALTMTGPVYAKGVPTRGDPAGPGEQPLAQLLGQGLLTSAGELHKRQRRLLQPLFHRERISEYAAAFAEIGSHDDWRDGEERDVHHDMVEMTLAVIARTVFDVDLDTAVAATIRRSVDLDLSPANGVGPGGRIAQRLRLPGVRRLEAARDDLHMVVHNLIADRRRQGTGGRDVLSLLLDARDDNGEAMSDDQVTDEALTLLLAGHETTANALSWTLSLLARHPNAQARLHAELDDVLGIGRVSLDDIPRLVWTTAIFNEAMRLYPPAWMMARRLREDRVICGYQLAAGSMLILSPYVVHRDPRWWPDPTAFRPERWTDDDSEPVGDERPRYAYFPFGGGARQCIGNSFAQLEGVVLLAERCRRWSFSPVGPQPPASKPRVTLRPASGVHLTVHARR